MLLKFRGKHYGKIESSGIHVLANLTNVPVSFLIHLEHEKHEHKNFVVNLIKTSVEFYSSFYIQTSTNFLLGHYF
jgi:hypothetical protein